MAKGKSKYNKELNAAILQVVENQIRDDEPQETRQTYERLKASEYSEKEARDLIGCVVSSEIFDMLKDKKPYDHNRFIAALKRLPTLPWE
ncbi:MAG: hypothetical protein ABFS17_05280 [Chloroflexota bacterium]